MLEFISIHKDRKNQKEIKNLYKQAFPLAERMPYFILKHKSKNKNADLFGIYEDNLFVGLWYAVTHKDVLFLYYLAIAPDFRGKGYGSRVLKQIEEKYSDYRIVLNIEEVDEKSPNYAQRLKRKAFYTSNGFFTLDYKVKEGSVVYDNLCYSKSGKGVTKQEYYELLKSYFGSVLYGIYKLISK